MVRVRAGVNSVFAIPIPIKALLEDQHSVPTRLRKGQGAKESGHNLAREQGDILLLFSDGVQEQGFLSFLKSLPEVLLASD